MSGPTGLADALAAGPFTLRRHRPDDLAELVGAVNASLEHLRPWMVWAQQPATDESLGEFLSGSIANFEAGIEFGYAIVESTEGGERIVGGAGLHPRLGPGAIEIGYWVHVDHVRRGAASGAARALRDAAIDPLGVEVVEIHCDPKNTASAAVARSSGFRLVGTEARAPRIPTESDHEMIWRYRRQGRS
ncbi:MAG: GNAT family N-acetyltransferase [Acidimicrobiales bacterium]